MPERDQSTDSFAKSIAGDIVLSESPGNAIQKWRNIFKIPQRLLADKMHVMPSVISDYESGRRKSPGVNFIQRIVNAFIDLDCLNGCIVTNEFQSLHNEVLSDAILDIKEYEKALGIADFMKIVNGTLVGSADAKIDGHIIVDSLKVITDLSPLDLMKLHTLTPGKAMIFANVHTGKSAFVAIKVTNLKPSAVVFHGISELSPLAERIAKTENIPIILSKMKTVDELLTALKTQNVL